MKGEKEVVLSNDFWSRVSRCPDCESLHVSKVLAAGMPVRLCLSCNYLWGEPWATLYVTFVAPLEAMVHQEFCFMEYKGSYWKALWAWLRRAFDSDFGS